jgi:hypothetical protein
MKTFLQSILQIIMISFVWLFLKTNLMAQAPDTQWEKKIGGNLSDWGASVQQTFDGGYIITGGTRFVATHYQVFLVKTNADGDTMWTKAFGGTGRDEGLAVQQTADSGYIVFANKPILGGVSWDVSLIRTDIYGDTLWTRSFGDSAYDLLNDGIQTTDSGFVFTGYTESLNTGSIDTWFVKTDTNGDTLWTRTFGGAQAEQGKAVQQTTDGGYIIAGYTASFGSGSPDFWLIKTDDSGDTLWTKAYGGSDWDICYSVQQTSDGGYIATGSSASFSGEHDVWLIKTDTNGDTLWTKIFGGSEEDQGRSVKQTSDNGYIIAGFTESFGNASREGWLIRTDVNGDSLWSRIYGSENWDQFRSVAVTPEGNYIITGDFESVTDPGQTDLWLVKTVQDVSGINENQTAVINNYHLNQNYPNPFNPTTKITFTLPKPEQVTLSVYNTLGQKVATLLDTKMNAGSHDVEFNASDLPSGIYFYRIQIGDASGSTGEFSQVRKMVLLR